MPPPTLSPEIPWTAYVDALLSWRRFVVWSVLLSWVLILVVGLAWPRQYESEAMLSFPPVNPQKVDQPPRAGIPIPLFKRFSKALGDEGVLARGLRTILAPGEIRSLRESVDSHISPVTTSPLGDTQRVTREDTVIGVRIAFAGPSEKAVKVVAALAKLCRDTLVRVYALELIEQRMSQINDEVKTALSERARYKVEMESLERQRGDLSQLAREFPGGEGGGGRQVVETREGGHRYLPAAVQLMGVRAKIADYSHEIRVRDHLVNLGTLRLRFLQTLNQRFDWQKLTGAQAPDTLGIVREDLQTFVAQNPGEESDLAILRAEVENLASTLASCAEGTSLAQLPTTRKKPRVPAMVGAGALAAVLVLLSALLGESWRRLHAIR